MPITPTLNFALWSAQALLALLFFAAGVPKILGRGLERWTGFDQLPRGVVVFIGVTEVLGAAGLVLPIMFQISAWLTPLAGLGLGIVVLMASGFHLRADERLNAFETVVWAAIAFVVAIGRWDAAAWPIRVAPGALIVALAVLMPTALIVVTILLRRPPSDGAHSTTRPNGSFQYHRQHSPL